MTSMAMTFSYFTHVQWKQFKFWITIRLQLWAHSNNLKLNKSKSHEMINYAKTRRKSQSVCPLPSNWALQLLELTTINLLKWLSSLLWISYYYWIYRLLKACIVSNFSKCMGWSRLCSICLSCHCFSAPDICLPILVKIYNGGRQEKNYSQFLTKPLDRATMINQHQLWRILVFKMRTNWFLWFLLILIMCGTGCYIH